ncbi:hypothetical protein BDV96DRAFT_651623 [Lophiotrema nucula]|uniref:Uncharacterized protein n=1 Tax=Lophiotrema nucula TaxID=690887 RepID=A0A6A5YSD1_9PLEO|nr:hypothetical protein BDV96DRAFT_651623 [Lophiotrema nucula]
MHFTTSVPIAILLAAASSSPVNIKRDKGVYISTDPEWGNREKSGLFGWKPFLENACQDLKGSPYDKAISSFGPDSGVACVLYQGYNCEGAQLPIWHPGYAEMGWNGWDNKVSSYACQSCAMGVGGCT